MENPSNKLRAGAQLGIFEGRAMKIHEKGHTKTRIEFMKHFKENYALEYCFSDSQVKEILRQV